MTHIYFLPFCEHCIYDLISHFLCIPFALVGLKASTLLVADGFVTSADESSATYLCYSSMKCLTVTLIWLSLWTVMLERTGPGVCDIAEHEEQLRFVCPC